MKAVRLTTHVDSETLTVSSPELKGFVGKDVEVLVIEKPPEEVAGVPKSGYGILRGTILQDDDPFGPAAPPEDWEAVR